MTDSRDVNADMILHCCTVMTDPAPTTDQNVDHAEYRGEALVVRGMIGGALMGLANLVPGISGGTMLLAVGVYPQFITGVAEVSTFRFRAKAVLLLCCVVAAATLAIVGLAGVIGGMVVEYRWLMYSIFIGLTLGGVPVLWRMIQRCDGPTERMSEQTTKRAQSRQPTPDVVFCSIIGIAVMAVIAVVDPEQWAVVGGGHQYALIFLAGLVAGSAMILPGLSGGYLLLVLGQYVTILTAIAAARDAAGAQDWAALFETFHVFVPLGIGVLVGVVGVSNLIKVLLVNYERPTLGVLLGLLLGAVIGLWPFVEGVAPEVGESFRGDTVIERDGQLVMEASERVVEPEDYPTEPFTPSPGQVLAAIGLVVVGFMVSSGVALLGRSSGNESKGG